MSSVRMSKDSATDDTSHCSGRRQSYPHPARNDLLFLIVRCVLGLATYVSGYSLLAGVVLIGAVGRCTPQAKERSRF